MKKHVVHKVYKVVKSIKLGLTFCFINFITLNCFAQQDPQYSLFMFDKMALNPAAAGSKDAVEVNLVSRNQWLDIQGAPVTNALLISAPTGGEHTGWGVEVMNDRIGPTTSSSVQGNYAYNIQLGKGKLAMGLGFGVYDYTFDWTTIDYKDKTDIYASANGSSKITPTAEAGLYYHTTSYYIGFSFNHLIESRLSNISIANDENFAPHEYFIAGKAFQSASGIIWNPSVILQLAQNSPPAVSINMNVFLAEKLWLGASYKLQYGCVFLAAYKASHVLSIGYAYDLGLNAIGVVGGGAHELSLTLDFASNKVTQVSPRFF
jgi:type IX secretion system PorP/SprF family membrane protein